MCTLAPTITTFLGVIKIQTAESRLTAFLCPAAAGKGHTAVGCEASDATVRIGCAADSAGVWYWMAAALAQSERGG